MNARTNFPGEDVDRIEVLIAAFERVDQRLAREHEENRDDLSAFKEEIRRAFPGNDPEGHRRYHEQLIEQAAARTRFWRDLTSKLMQQGIWAVLMGVLAALGWAALAWLKGAR